MKTFISHSNHRGTHIYFISILIIIMVWSVSAELIHNSFILPRLGEVVIDALNILLSSDKMMALLISFSKLGAAMFFSFLVASLINILYIINDKSYYFFRPALTILKTFPLVSVIIILLIWFGNDISPLLITNLVILPVMVEEIRHGVDFVRKFNTDDLKLLDQNYPLLIRYIYVPLLSPFIMMALLQTLGLGIKVMIMAELICQTEKGIGAMMYLAKMNVDISGLFALSGIIVIIILSIESLVTICKKRLNNLLFY